MKIFIMRNNDIMEYDDLYDYIEEIISDDYVAELINEKYGEIELPVIGYMSAGEILKKVDNVAFQMVREEQIDFIEQDILDDLNLMEICSFYGDRISYNKEILMNLI